MRWMMGSSPRRTGRRARRPWSSLVVSMLLPLMIAACSAGSVPQNRFFRLRPMPDDMAPVANPLPGVLVVERFGAEGLIGERPILYTNGTALELRQHAYEYWVQPPPDLLQEQMTVYLTARKMASAVTTPEMRIPPDFVLRGRINRFERVLGTDDARVIIEARMSLTDARHNRLLLAETYRATVPVSGADVPASVDAFNRGTEQILAELTADLARPQGTAAR